MYSEVSQLTSIIKDSKKFLIIQADNPDADSLGSALALEEIIGSLGKEVSLFCAIQMPTYLQYMSGWDRVSQDFDKNFDVSILVDVSTTSLLDKLLQNPMNKGILASKPCIVLDHHMSVGNTIPFAKIMINDGERASTGELIYVIAQEGQLPLSLSAMEYITFSILGDTQGMSNQLTTPTTYRIMASMIEAGVDRPKLEEQRRAHSKMSVEIYKYKADLIKRTELTDNRMVASVSVTQEEINKYSPIYNPAPLIQGDMLQISDVLVAIVFKCYDDGKVTAAIRCNAGAPIAAELAEHFNGGGHAYASGFKDTSGRPFIEIKRECIQTANDLLLKR